MRENLHNENAYIKKPYSIRQEHRGTATTRTSGVKTVKVLTKIIHYTHFRRQMCVKCIKVIVILHLHAVQEMHEILLFTLLKAHCISRIQWNALSTNEMVHYITSHCIINFLVIFGEEGMHSYE